MTKKGRTVGVKLQPDDLVAVNRLLESNGYQTLGGFIRDLVHQELTIVKGQVNPDIYQRLTSIEEKVNLLLERNNTPATNPVPVVSSEYNLAGNVARGVGFEPTGPFGHRLSRPAPYQARRPPRIGCQSVCLAED